MKKLDNTSLSLLFKKLALFLKAGISPADAMAVMETEEEDKELKEFYKNGCALMDQGSGIGFVFEDKAFPLFVAPMLKVGEGVGRLEQTLVSLGDYFENKARTSLAIKNALIYPIVLFVLMIGVIIILLTKVLPVFQSVYASLGGSLTGISGGLLKLGQALNTALPYIGLGAGLVILIGVIIFAFEKTRERALSVIRRYSSDKGVSKKLNSARFAQALAMAVSSGMTLEEAVISASSLLEDNTRAKKRCENCVREINEGCDALEALTRADIIDKASCRMLALGFKAGKGDDTMWEIAHRLSYKADEALNERVSQIEPALVIVTSLLVGVILLSVMLPLVDIMSAI